MRDPGLRSRNFGGQLLDVAGEQKEREHGGLGDIRREHVALSEHGLVGDPLLDRFLLRQLDEVLVVLHAERADAAARRREDHPAVTGPEVHQEVLRRHLRHVEHLLDHGG